MTLRQSKNKNTGAGTRVFTYIHDAAIKNNHKMAEKSGHIPQKSRFAQEFLNNNNIAK